MSASFFLTVSAAFLFVAMMFFRGQRASLIRDIAFGGLLVVSILLYVAYAVADSFTDAGINQAVWFHLRYGLRGAGFGAYTTLIAAATAGLAGALALCFAVSFWRRTPAGAQPAWGIMPFGLLLVSGAFNPAIHDLAHLRPPAEATGSDFYEYYRTPYIKPTGSGARNLVFIYAEGLERTYFDETRFPGLIKHLRRLEQQGTHFTDIRQVIGTEFTMGGMVASFCGVPLFTPASGNSMAGVDLFLPGARGLGNLLHEVDYRLTFLAGAPLRFAGKGKFFRTQEFDKVEGMAELLPHLPDPTYRSPWGWYDDSLFEIAFARFTRLAGEDRPFALFLLTLDTHHPQGHMSRSAQGIVYGDGTNPMLNAVAAADVLIAEFIERIRSSPYGQDTVVVLASDHLGLGNTASDQLNQGDRRNLFMVLEPDRKEGKGIDVPGSTLDTGTTVLPFLGFEGEIGLGRNLADPAVSPAKLQFIQQAGNLQRWRENISAFWWFPRLDGSLRVDPGRQVMVLNGREFSIPVLITIQPDRVVQLTFPSDPAVPLLQQLLRLPTSAPYLLIDRMEHLGRIYSSGDTGWCIFTEAGDHMIKVVRVGDDLTLSADEITKLFTDGPDDVGDPDKDITYVLRHRAR